MARKESRVIVVRKKRGHGHGHHGGAWKVAYADFVTAMMAFFMVMWIMGMDSNVKDLIEGYFTNPVGFKKAYGAGDNPLAVGNSPINPNLKRLAAMVREYQRRRFEEARVRLQQKLSGLSELEQGGAYVEIELTGEGLRIELVEGEEGETFFALRSAELTPAAAAALAVIAPELAQLPNDVVIEGHTDALPFSDARGYSNWELSADRANAARRKLTAEGLPAGRVLEVRAHAERDPRIPDRPLAAANRRVTLLLPFREPSAPAYPYPVYPAALAAPAPERGGD